MSLTSIIMPSYNSGNYIEASIRSAIAQSTGDWEMLVSDDGSTDETLAIVEKLAREDKRIGLIAGGKNRGPAHARNVAIKAANGRYITFLDSDDLWKPEKLELQIDFMRKRDIAFSFSSYDRIDEEGNFINTHRVEKPVTYRGLLKSNTIGCLTAIYDTEKIGKVYMPDIRKRQDFGLWLRILKKVDAAYPVPHSLAQYRVRTGSVSANKLTAAKYTWSLYRDVEKLGLVRSAYYFAHYVTHGVLSTYVKPHLGK